MIGRHNLRLASTAAALAFALLDARGSADAWSTTIEIGAQKIERLGVKLEKVVAAATEPLALLPATVVPAMNARIAATAPYAGTVVRVHVLPGQTIAAGASLVTVASRELLDAFGQQSQSEAELQAALAVARRKRELASKGIASTTVADEAEAQVDKIKAVLDKHKRAVAIGGITSLDDGTYTIVAPVAGRIAEVLVMTGDAITSMAATVRLDTSDELWLEAQAPASVANTIRPGHSVRVSGGGDVTGEVVAIGGTLDRLTRSARLYARLAPNSGLVGGQMVTIELMRAATSGALAVPAASVSWIGEGYAVFVQDERGFRLTPVTVHGKSAVTATVSGELAPGQLVAASGLPLLEQLIPGQ